MNSRSQNTRQKRMQQQHEKEATLSPLELSWVHTLIDYPDPTTVSMHTRDTSSMSSLSKAEKAQRRKLLNRKSAREARIRKVMYEQSLQIKIRELEQQRRTLLEQVQRYTEENNLMKQSMLYRDVQYD